MSGDKNGRRGIYRVDKFVVPGHARDEFTQKVRATHQLLRARPGFQRDLVLEQTAGPGDFNFVTIVEWDHEASMEDARAVVGAMHRRSGFSPHEAFARLGIEVDLGYYMRLDF